VGSFRFLSHPQYRGQKQDYWPALWYPVATVDQGSALPPTTGTSAAAAQHYTVDQAFQAACTRPDIDPSKGYESFEITFGESLLVRGCLFGKPYSQLTTISGGRSTIRHL